MGWSFRVGRLAGIDIFVHFTFLLLLAWVALSGFVATGDPSAAAVGVLLTGAVFFIIVLHELGHALAARHYGIPTRDITLLPIGGVARLERMPDKPGQELVVALAGPAVNVVLALLLVPFSTVRTPDDLGRVLTGAGGIADYLVAVNVGLTLFNLLPAFPMDGGRVLRAVLAMRLGTGRATRVAARVGQGMAVLFFLVGAGALDQFGVDFSPMLMLLAVFVWIGAREEAAAVRPRAGLAGVPVGAVMVRQFATVDPDDTLEAVSRYARRTFQYDFPVVVAGRVIGLLGRADLRYGLSEIGPSGRVMQVMRRDFPTVSPEDPAERAVALLAGGAPVVPVLYYGRLVGVLTAETMAQFLWHRGSMAAGDGGRSRWDRAKSRV
jgi:Zn-dependent protease/CBS domain-containing protein